MAIGHLESQSELCIFPPDKSKHYPQRVKCQKLDNNEGVKSAAWSKAEDELLRNYILRKGYQNWTTPLQRAGLQRCGKSCRLRWLTFSPPSSSRKGKEAAD